MRKILHIIKKFVVYPLLVVILLFVIALIITHFVTHSSNDRNWNDDQSVLPYAEISGDNATIHNIRDFTYASTISYTIHYYDKTFDLNKIQKVWYVVEPFSGIPGSAHTFLSFQFADNQYVSISVEIRKEKGESFNPFRGLFNQYELMYVIADEKDVIKLRTNYRKDKVFLYPAKTDKARELFVSMLERANDLKDQPEFYNTVTNTCTTNIVHHIDAITPKRVPLLNLQVLFPANSDKLAYKLGLLDTNLSFEQARERYYITDKAMKYAGDPNFSVKIREDNDAIPFF